MPRRIHYFYPEEETKYDTIKTIQRLEKLCGHSVRMVVDTVNGKLEIKGRKYNGNIENTASGYIFSGNDGVMTLGCDMLKLVRNPDYHMITIRVLGPSSDSH